MRQGRLGIVGFAIGIMNFVLASAVAASLLTKYVAGTMEEASGIVMWSGFIIAMTVITALVGFMLSLGGLFEKDRRHLFASMGLILNTLYGCLGAGIYLLQPADIDPLGGAAMG